MHLDRLEATYWLALAFKLDRVRRRDRNGLVLTADRMCGLGLLDLVLLDPAALPEPLRRFAPVLAGLHAAEGQVSAMAFLVDELVDHGVTLIPVTHPAYPRHVLETLTPDKAPVLLSVAGDPALLGKPGVCVSGSRKSGSEGLAFARAVGGALATRSVAVISGLAAGPDREGLAGALERDGTAVGVAPEGILLTRAARDPAVGGGRLCVVSEFFPKQRWQAGLAMARNVTLAGASRSLVVADCVAEGGTTDQVAVHCRFGLPVFVRRGRGEGPWVERVAAVAGVRSIVWNQGDDVDVYLVLDSPRDDARTPPTSAPPSPQAPAPRPDELATLEEAVAARRAELAELDRSIAERRAELAALDAGLVVPPLVSDVAAPEGPVRTEAAETALLGALQRSDRALALKELAEVVGVSQRVAREAAKALVDAGRVDVVRSGRTSKYVVARELGLFGVEARRR